MIKQNAGTEHTAKKDACIDFRSLFLVRIDIFEQQLCHGGKKDLMAIG